jgi:hypothetical protein
MATPNLSNLTFRRIFMDADKNHAHFFRTGTVSSSGVLKHGPALKNRILSKYTIAHFDGKGV